MSVQFAPEIEDEQRIAEVWLAEFADALATGDAAAATDLFIPDGHWRDVLAFTWTIVTHSGRAAIEAGPPADAGPDPRHRPRTCPTTARRRAGCAAPARTASRPSSSSTPRSGHANAVVRLVESGDGWRAWSLLTTLETLHGWPDGRPPEVSDAERYSRDFGGANWLDQRQKALAYDRPRPGRRGRRRRPGRPLDRGAAQGAWASTR